MEERPAQTNANVDDSAPRPWPSWPQALGSRQPLQRKHQPVNQEKETVLLPLCSPPSSPGEQFQASEPEEVPVSLDQPPEDNRLPCYNEVQTRDSVKRRPPSRQFRRSQSGCGDLGDFRAMKSSPENGAKEENGDEAFPPKSQAPGSPPLRRCPSGQRSRRRRAGHREGPQHEEAVGSCTEGAGQRPAQAFGPEAESGRRSPTE
ncbi:hypothetical protein CB1_000750018 [Camelus ferus]|nr:hypothetical protein CB1_000750018 [Camelus ferus]